MDGLETVRLVSYSVGCRNLQLHHYASSCIHVGMKTTCCIYIYAESWTRLNITHDTLQSHECYFTPPVLICQAGAVHALMCDQTFNRIILSQLARDERCLPPSSWKSWTSKVLFPDFVCWGVCENVRFWFECVANYEQKSRNIASIYTGCPDQITNVAK